MGLMLMARMAEWVFPATAIDLNSVDTPAYSQQHMTPEEHYVKCMDAAYAAADRETCLQMMRKAEGVLRGEFGAQPSAEGTGDEAVAN